MRRTAAFVFVALVVLSRVGQAQTVQGLQYKMTMKASAGGFGEMPSPAIVMSMSGSKARMDMNFEMPGGMGAMNMSTIIDLATKKVVVLHHGEKVYSEQNIPNPLAGMDTAGMRPNIKIISNGTAKSDHKLVDGRDARRVLMAGDFGAKNPMPMMTIKEGNKLVMVAEQWVSDDAELADAYKKFGSAFADDLIPGGDVLTKAGTAGFPLKTVVMMVQVPKSASYDAEALLKAADKTEGLVMLMNMSISDIKLGPLDAAMFTVPQTYTKR